MPRSRSLAPAALLLVLALLAGACTTAVNPATGRREVVLMSEEDEQRLGSEAAREIEATLGLVRDPELNAYVNEVGSELAAHAPRQDVEYRFAIVEMDEPNAFALPDGRVYVSRGLLLLANTESELAHVLGHEIGHVAARHAAARDAHLKTLGLATLLGYILSGGNAKEASDTESPGGSPIARYARNQEREADRIGQEIAADARVEPSGMARFLIALDNYTKLTRGFSMPQTYFATHPATRERMAEAATQAQLRTWRRGVERGGAAAEWSYEEARDAYLERIGGMVVERPAHEGVFVDNRFLHADLGFSLRFPHGWETRNEAARVAAIAPKRDGVTLLELQGEGDDPIAAAREYAQNEALALRNAAPVRIGELPAFRATARVPTRTGPIDAEITWLAYDGRIYRLIGGVAAGPLRKYEGVFRNFARSFRPLTPEDAAAISEPRLRIASAREGETLAALSERTGNEWGLTYTAVANSVFTHDALREGQRIKVAVSEPYVPSPVPPPGEEGSETSAPSAAR